ncbi:hypothetical protein ACN27G_12110 [Plantactinospora sp. WMMB334]|uniref:hypothetical protein n=1 Tax=Plantactinospora sp. WMMB334 TaxID=3404119 RepID=UPI003B93DA8C
MTDYWGGWSADEPEFGGPEDEAEQSGELADLGGDPAGDDGYPVEGSDGGYPVEGFGAADPVEGFGSADPDGLPGGPPMPLGYDDLPAEETPDPYPHAGPEASEGLGFGADTYPEVPAEVGFGAADPPVGADPDLDPYADTGPAWTDPPELPELGAPPEPVDGFPWTDPALLGTPVDASAATLPGPDGTVGPEELAGYAGTELPTGGDPWAALAASDDPATSTLARFWSPEER